jgi:hypothetical protein
MACESSCADLDTAVSWQLVEGITIGIGGVLTVGGVDTRCKTPKTGVSNICASFGTCIAVVVGKSVVQAGETVCNEALPLGTAGQRRVIYGHTIG